MEQMLLPLVLFAGLGAMMYFSMKKQKRAAAATKQMHESLVPGARVMTTSGLHGTVTAIADDTIELEIAPGLRTTWVRAAVREIVVPGPAEDNDYETIDSGEYDAIDDRVVDADEVPPMGRGIIMWAGRSPGYIAAGPRRRKIGIAVEGLELCAEEIGATWQHQLGSS